MTRPKYMEELISRLRANSDWQEATRLSIQETRSLISYIESLESESEPTAEDDLREHGVAYFVDGKRVDPNRVTYVRS